MTTYRNIHGRSIRAVATDPTAEVSEGEIWYNTSSDTFKSIVSVEAWSSGSSMMVSRRQLGGAGTQTSALGFGGDSGPPGLNETNSTEEYNGSGWSTGGNLGTSRTALTGCGTQTAGLAFGGRTGPTKQVTTTEEYGGASWTSGGAMGTARRYLAGAGIQTAGLAIGGGTGGAPGASTAQTATEEYDGSSWTAGGALNTAGQSTQGSAGTQTAAAYFGSSPDTDGTEEYDGSSWTNTGNLNTARSGGSGFGIQTAAIYAGGPTSITATENYDGTSWSTSPATLGTARYAAKAQGSNTAGVYFSGANSPGGSSTLTEEYNKSTNVITGAAWASGGALNTGRYGLRGTGTQTAMVVAGGNVPPNTNTAVAEEYNGSSWTNTTSLPAVIQDGNMTGTETASIYAGGTINPGSYPGNTNAYNGSSWTSGGNMNTDVSQYALTGTSTAAVAFGGYIGSGPGRSADVQNYNGSSWTANPTSLPAARGLMRSAGTQTACILVGGNNPPGSPSQPIDSLEWDGSSISTGPNNIVGMNDHGGWGTSTETFFMGGDQPTGTGGTGPKAVGNFYYNGTSWATSVNMTTGKNTFGFSKSPNTAGLVCGGNGPSPHMNTTEEFTPETTALNVKTLTQS